MEKRLVFFPTYNESKNVERLIGSIREYLPDADILVVDDASPDGTGELLEQLRARVPGVSVIHRPGKLGLGSAHKLAMYHARDNGYDRLITMDADFSHHPRYLGRFVELLGNFDFVTGSRYAHGGQSDYGVGRQIISRTANFFAKLALGLTLEEHTTMYRGFTRDLLRRLDIDSIKSEGYSFAVESLQQIATITDRMTEFPIHFENRAAGASKISQAEIYKAVLTIQRLGLRRLLRRKPRPARPITDLRCALCAGSRFQEVYPAREEGSSALHDASPYSCATHSGRTHGDIVKCLTCGLIFMKPRLTPEELVGEYAEAVDPVYLENVDARMSTFRYNLRSVRQYFRPGDRVLEIGSYCGAFLKVAADEGIDIMGVEPSAWAAEASTRIADAPVVCGTTNDLPADTQRFDVIAAWDVLEHFADPMRELFRINRLLNDRGVLLFSTLMIDNWFPRLAGSRWPWLMDMHLFYFTEETIRQVIEKAGFEIVEDGKYCHIVTLGYLLDKLGTLGAPGAKALSNAVKTLPWARAEIPFRFGDIKLFVCRKVRDAARDQTSEPSHAAPIPEPEPRISSRASAPAPAAQLA